MVMVVMVKRIDHPSPYQNTIVRPAKMMAQMMAAAYTSPSIALLRLISRLSAARSASISSRVAVEGSGGGHDTVPIYPIRLRYHEPSAYWPICQFPVSSV